MTASILPFRPKVLSGSEISKQGVRNFGLRLNATNEECASQKVAVALVDESQWLRAAGVSSFAKLIRTEHFCRTGKITARGEKIYDFEFRESDPFKEYD